MAVNGYELDWDSTIDQDEQQPFKVLDEGDYDFTVDRIEKTTVGENSEKYSGMKMAVVYFNIHVRGEEDVSVKENFILHSNFTWKIGALLVSTGLKKKGESITGSYWNKLPGANGRCKIVQTKAKNKDIVYNNIDTFYAPNSSQDSGSNKWAL